MNEQTKCANCGGTEKVNFFGADCGECPDCHVPKDENVSRPSYLVSRAEMEAWEREIGKRYVRNWRLPNL